MDLNLGYLIIDSIPLVSQKNRSQHITFPVDKLVILADGD